MATRAASEYDFLTGTNSSNKSSEPKHWSLMKKVFMLILLLLALIIWVMGAFTGFKAPNVNITESIIENQIQFVA